MGTFINTFEQRFWTLDTFINVTFVFKCKHCVVQNADKAIY